MGTLVNVTAVLVGSSLGMLIGRKLPERFRQVVLVGLGLFTLALGVHLALGWQAVIVVVMSVVFGGLLGELLRIERAIERFANWLKGRIAGVGPGFAQGFVTASILFCVGPMAMWGAVKEGLTGDATLLYIKSAMDTVASLILASAFGLGVAFSIIAILLVQGSLTLLGVLLPAMPEQALLKDIDAVGGILIIGIGINLLGLKKIKVANFLPALLIAALVVPISLAVKKKLAASKTPPLVQVKQGSILLNFSPEDISDATVEEGLDESARFVHHIDPERFEELFLTIDGARARWGPLLPPKVEGIGWGWIVDQDPLLRRYLKDGQRVQIMMSRKYRPRFCMGRPWGSRKPVLYYSAK